MAALALVTVLYKSDQVLEGFLQSLSIQNFQDYHLYLVDNSANPETDHLLTTLFSRYPVPAYTHIKNLTNVGAAQGNNQGIAEALKGAFTHVLLLNNDIELTSATLLEEMMQQAISQKEALIIPKMLYFDSRKICMAGAHLYLNTGVTEHIGAGETDWGQFDKPSYFNYGPTTFMLLAREVFEKVGQLDDRYFAYYEDTDFIYRAGLQGYKVYYMPSLVVLHKESSLTGGHRSPFFIFYINRNRIYFIRKHFKGFHWMKAMASMGLDFLRMFRHYTAPQRKVLVKAVWKGLFIKVQFMN